MHQWRIGEKKTQFLHEMLLLLPSLNEDKLYVWLIPVLDANQIFMEKEILPLLKSALSDRDSAFQSHVEKWLKWEEKNQTQLFEGSGARLEVLSQVSAWLACDEAPFWTH